MSEEREARISDLRTAIEGECDGLHTTYQQAAAIIDYMDSEQAARQPTGANETTLRVLSSHAIRKHEGVTIFGDPAQVLKIMAAIEGATARPHGVDDGACKQCYTEATGREPVAWMYEGTRIGTQFSGARLDHYFSKPEGGYIKGKPLYAAPIGDNGAKDCCQGRAPSHECWEECGGTKRRAQPAESKRVELTEGQVIEAIQKACGEYRHGCSYSFEDVWNCIEAALLARAQAKGE